MSNEPIGFSESLLDDEPACESCNELEQQLTAALAAHEETKRKLEYETAKIVALHNHHCESEGCCAAPDGPYEGAALDYVNKFHEYKKRAETAEAKLKELQEQKPVYEALNPDDDSWFELPRLEGFEDYTTRIVYAYPIDVEALRQRVAEQQAVGRAMKCQCVSSGAEELESLLQQARKEENEACAKVCEAQIGKMYMQDAGITLCAKAIRARMK